MERPRCRLIGEDGNVFNVIGLVSRALKQADRGDEAKRFTQEAFGARSYDEVLALVQQYVEVE